MRYKSKHSQYCIHSRICVYGIPSCVCNLLWMAVVMMYMHLSSHHGSVRQGLAVCGSPQFGRMEKT